MRDELDQARSSAGPRRSAATTGGGKTARRSGPIREIGDDGEYGEDDAASRLLTSLRAAEILALSLSLRTPAFISLASAWRTKCFVLTAPSWPAWPRSRLTASGNLASTVKGSSQGCLAQLDEREEGGRTRAGEKVLPRGLQRPRVDGVDDIDERRERARERVDDAPAEGLKREGA